MRIACPGCAAEYEVPASRLPPRKIVRCARCGGEWVPVREVVDDSPPPEAARPLDPAPSLPVVTASSLPVVTASSLPVVTAMDRLAASTPPPRSRAGLIGAWVLTVVVLAASAAATIEWRSDIVRAWPPSGRILAPNSQIVPAPAQTMSKNVE